MSDIIEPEPLKPFTDYCQHDPKKRHGKMFSFKVLNADVMESLFFSQFPADKVVLPSIFVSVGFCRECLKPIRETFVNLLEYEEESEDDDD